MTTLSQPAETAGSDHPPARSGTPTAWMALGLLALLVAGWLFADLIVCGAIRTGATVWAWKRGESLHIGRLDFDGGGSLRATDIEWSRGKVDHRSTFRCEMAILMPASIRDLILPRSGHDRLWIRELWLAKTRLLLDSRAGKTATGSEARAKKEPVVLPLVLLPGSFYAGPVEAVFIGETGRLAIHDLRLDLPSRWTGRVSFRAAEADLGAGHRVIPASAARAYWEPGSLRIGSLPLGEGLSLGEFSLRLLPKRLDFGLRGTIGKGLIRGDGSIGGKNQLELTLVGEQLSIEAVAGLMPGPAKASGTIDQARLSFRGDLQKPMDADGSIRLVGRNFRWEGRGWESLRLAAAMTGRNLTLSELALRQGENELVAEGHSSLPGDWHALLRAPFTANFRALLTDAGTLASLFGPDASLLGGSLYLDGSVRGADNKAEGYCNFSGLGTKFRRLTVDWIKGCLFFEGPSTRLPYAEAAAGTDRISLSRWSVDNSRPHAYQGEADVSVKDLARRLGQLGVPVAPNIGVGTLAGSWKGRGDMNAHHGEFRLRFTEWISSWTKGGVSGSSEGTYDPTGLKLGKVQMIQDDLTLSLGLTATRQRLDLSSISVVRAASKKPMASGEITLPLDLVDLWTGGDPVKTLAMDQPMTVKLVADGLQAEQLAELLGQKSSCTGKLGGWITAGGTPAAPELNGTVAIAGFSPDAGSPAGELSMDLHTAAGETTITVHQNNGTEVLDGECTLPLRLAKAEGNVVPDTAAKLKGSLQMKKLSLDGWMSILTGSPSTALKSITAEGETTFSGTVGQPQAQGHVEIKASKADLSAPAQLENLTLPLVFSNAVATIGQGTASYQGQPVALSGTVDWSAGMASAKSNFRISGTNLPLELAPGLRAMAKADLTYSWRTSSPALLGGTLLIDPLSVDLARRMAPSFCPPAFVAALNPPPSVTNAATQWDLHLSMATNVPRAEGPSVDINLHLTGSNNTPTMEGSVTANAQTLRLPGGRFDLPRATVAFTKQGNSLSGTATGITAAGLGALQLGGSLENPTAAIDAAGGITAADWILACSMSSARRLAPSVLLAWLRQQMLLPVPARAWSTRVQPEANPAALGFYGTPWIWNFLPGPSEGSGEQPAR
ncbi:MAG: hypothetical protein EBR40_06930 [Proteobacteria bacterium]|nr:hypothetical protein [Pseudomonadota bacterium]